MPPQPGDENFVGLETDEAEDDTIDNTEESGA
jgi:hypothetical protein